MIGHNYHQPDQAFYNELEQAITENDSHKVLSCLLRMGISGADIPRVVCADTITNNDVKGIPLYVLAKGKDIKILQHFQEFGVILPKDIQAPPFEPPRPAGLKTNSKFAQHFIFRRTREGESLFKFQPACGGFCFEYVRFHLSTHKRHPTENFLDKLLRELHEHSVNFYQRIYGYQHNTTHVLDYNYRILQSTLKEKGGVLQTYDALLDKAEFVLVTLNFANVGHCLVIRKLQTSNGLRYEFFDPTAYDGKLLTADELNKEFNEQMQRYTEEWQWGEFQSFYLADMGSHIKKMGHLQQHQGKQIFKNMHYLTQAFKEEDKYKMTPFLIHFDMTPESFSLHYSPSYAVLNYLVYSKKRDFCDVIISTMSDKNFQRLAEAAFAQKQYLNHVQQMLQMLIEKGNDKRLPASLVQDIRDYIEFKTPFNKLQK